MKKAWDQKRRTNGVAISLVISLLAAFLFLFLLFLYGNFNPRKIDTTQTILIKSSAEEVWQYASDFEGAFERSNSDHAGTEIISDPEQPFRDSLRFLQHEYVGGILGRLDGMVYDVFPPKRFRWKANGTYSLMGVDVIQLEEGGDFRIEQVNYSDQLLVSHRVYGQFPDTFFGRSLSWLMTSVWSLEQDAARHTRIELEYFKRQLENQ